MAEKINTQEKMNGQKSSEEMAEASEMSQASVGDATEEAIDDVLMVLNELDQYSGGKGGISEIPNELRNPVRFLINTMITLRDAFDDPLFKDVLDDMSEQKMNGQVPSLLVAVARNVPMEELTKLADDENYEDVQSAVNDRVSKQKEEEKSEKTLYANFDKSKKNIDAYCAKMGYDETRKKKLYARINMLRNIFADGLVIEDEVADIDKIDNYDSDIEMYKSRVSQEPVKTVLPDKASIDEQMAQKSMPKLSPQPSMESVGGFSQPDYMNTGKRKIFGKK